MLAKIRLDNLEADTVFIEEKEWVKRFEVNINGVKELPNMEAIQWALSVGRIGSRWQLGNDMFIKVKDKDDDWQQYYKPKQEKKTASSSSCWGSCSSNSCNKGNCGGDCSSC